MTFSVLVVCSANICRSPMAEFLLRARSGLTVASAGTHALTGRPIDSASAHALRDLGVEAAGHAARQLTPPLVDAADLVLTATQRHTDEVVALAAAAGPKTFTLREFARLAAAAPPTPDRIALIGDLHSRRDGPQPARDDIGDPFAAPYAQMQACAAALSTAVDEIVKVLDQP